MKKHVFPKLFFFSLFGSPIDFPKWTFINVQIAFFRMALKITFFCKFFSYLHVFINLFSYINSISIDRIEILKVLQYTTFKKSWAKHRGRTSRKNIEEEHRGRT